MRPTHCKYLNEVKVKQRWRGNSTYCLRYWNYVRMPSVFWYASPHLPFTVLKRFYINTVIVNIYSCVAISPTVYGIETYLYQSRTRLCMICCNSTYRLRYWNLKKRFTVDFLRLCCNSPYRLRYWNTPNILPGSPNARRLQQHLPFTVCAEGCETAEEQSDDEVRTSQVPEQSEGKTQVIWQ